MWRGVFATLDLMTQGRAAWNVVTSLNDGEAQNMGRDEAVAHDLRYDRADEFMEIVLGHWDAWEDDAIVQDKATGLFAKPDKVHRLDYEGRYFRSRGPFTVPRSAQGHPVIIQAGSSGRGKAFGARWGEVIFVVYPSIEVGQRDYAGFKADVARFGRDPEATSRSPTSSTPWRRPPRRKPRTSGRRSKSCRSRSTRCRCSRKRSISISRRKAWTSRSPPRSSRKCPACKASATGVLAASGKQKSDGARLHPHQRPRPRAQRHRRRPEGGRRPARAMVRRRRPATALSSPPPTCPAPMKTSCASSCRSCSGAACSARILPASTLRENFGLPVPAIGAWRAMRAPVS